MNWKERLADEAVLIVACVCISTLLGVLIINIREYNVCQLEQSNTIAELREDIMNLENAIHIIAEHEQGE